MVLIAIKTEVHFILIFAKCLNNLLKGLELPTIHHSSLLRLPSETYQTSVKVQVVFGWLHLAWTSPTGNGHTAG